MLEVALYKCLLHYIFISAIWYYINIYILNFFFLSLIFWLPSYELCKSLNACFTSYMCEFVLMGVQLPKWSAAIVDIEESTYLRCKEQPGNGFDLDMIILLS